MRLEIEELKDTLKRCKNLAALVRQDTTPFELGSVMCNIRMDLESLYNQIEDLESKLLVQDKNENK